MEASASRIGGIFDKLGTHISGRLGNIGQNLGKGGGIFAGASGVLAMAAPLGAAGVAMGAFGAIAIPVLAKVETAHKQLLAAQLQYTKAATAAGRASALKAEQRATEGLTASQKGLMGQVDGLKASWGKLENQMTPVIVTVASLGIKLATALMPVLSALAQAGAGVLAPLIEMLTRFVKSPFFTQFTATLTVLADQMGQVLGPALIGLLRLFMQLFMQAGPAGVQLLQILLPLIILLATDLVPVIAFVAKLTAAILKWLQHTHLLLPLLAWLALVILALEAPVLAVVAAVAILIAIGVELGKHWRQIWHAILVAVDGVWSWIKGHWPLLLGILTGPVGLAVAYIVTHWHQVAGVFSAVLAAVRRGWNAVYGVLVSPVIRAYREIMGWLAEIVNFIGSIPSRIAGALGSIPGKILGAIGLEHGGIVGAAAAGGPHGGLTQVAERGGELIRLPTGSMVYAHGQSDAMLGQMGAPVQVILQVQHPVSGLEQMFVSWLKQSIRVRGGDPSVLGR
jgi:phage-related protein